jgi:hypothetical protein
MWVKLKKHIGEGSIWYSLPSDDNEVKFVEGVAISYKIEGGEVEKKEIAFRYVPWERIINGIKYYLELKCPFINGENSIIELDQIEINDEEIKRYTDNNK